MKINQITLKNFQLFKEQIISFDKLNLIIGTNLDDIAQSSNGSGKSTILNALIFALYGTVTNYNLNELIRIGKKEAEVELMLSHNNKDYIISRKLPSALSITENGKKLEFNTATFAQNYLDKIFGDLTSFRTYRTIDQLKGVNLLDLGITSLRKNLMQFTDELFSKIRNNLLVKKLNKERFSVDKKLYHFYLSEKRRKILENGIKTLQEEEK